MRFFVLCSLFFSISSQAAPIDLTDETFERAFDSKDFVTLEKLAPYASDAVKTKALYKCVAHEWEEGTDLLLRLGADPFGKYGDYTPFHILVQNDDHERVSKLLSKGHPNLNELLGYAAFGVHLNPLGFAASAEMAERLIDAGATIVYQNSVRGNSTVIHFSRPEYHVLEYFLSLGVDPLEKDEYFGKDLIERYLSKKYISKKRKAIELLFSKVEITDSYLNSVFKGYLENLQDRGSSFELGELRTMEFFGEMKPEFAKELVQLLGEKTKKAVRFYEKEKNTGWAKMARNTMNHYGETLVNLAGLGGGVYRSGLSRFVKEQTEAYTEWLTKQNPDIESIKYENEGDFALARALLENERTKEEKEKLIEFLNKKYEEKNDPRFLDLLTILINAPTKE